MTLSTALPPPLSPVLLAGLALRALPLRPVQMAVSAAFAAMRQRHAAVFERLADLGDCRVLIDPSDLPCCFLLTLGGPAPGIAVLADDAGLPAGLARLRAPLATLLALLEGRLDGDALFFARDLRMSGDTETVVALRNAVDGADIDVRRDLVEAAGPFGRPLSLLLRHGETLLDGAGAALGVLQASAARDAERRLRSLESRLDSLQQQTAAAPRRRANAAPPAAAATTATPERV